MAHRFSSEITNMIIDYVGDEFDSTGTTRRTLRACARVNRAWYPRSRYRLHRRFNVESGEHCVALAKAVRAQPVAGFVPFVEVPEFICFFGSPSDEDKEQYGLDEDTMMWEDGPLAAVGVVFPNVRGIYFECCAWAWMDDLTRSYFATAFPGLRTFTMSATAFDTVAGLVAFLAGFPLLQTLDAHDPTVDKCVLDSERDLLWMGERDSTSPVAGAVPYLHELWVRDITWELLSVLSDLHAFRSLRVVDITTTKHQSPSYSRGTLPGLLCSLGHSVETLSLYLGTSLSPVGEEGRNLLPIDLGRKMSGLRRFELSVFGDVGQETRHWLGCMTSTLTAPSLESVDISLCDVPGDPLDFIDWRKLDKALSDIRHFACLTIATDWASFGANKSARGVAGCMRELKARDGLRFVQLVD